MLSHRRIILFTTLIGIVLLAYTNCGQMYSLSTASRDPIEFPVEDLKFKVKTASILRSTRAHDSFNSCLGVANPSGNSKIQYASKKSLLSAEGDPDAINSPMLFALTNIAFEVCMDLINLEKVKLSQERKIFTKINFSQSLNQTSSEDLSDVINNISRSCWGRSASLVEKNILVEGLSEISNLNNISAMSYLCTSMLGAFSGIED